MKENDTRPNIINNQSPPSLLLIVNHEKKAQRLIKALNPDGYRFDTILNLNYPLLLKPDSQPDLAILWFPYVSFEALPALKNIVNQIKQSGNAITNLPILLIINQDSSHWVEPAFKHGVTDILTRPIHPLILRQRVHLILRARQTEQTEQRFRTIADFTYDWEYWINENNELIYNSPAAERITGYPQSAFLNNPSLLEEIIHPEDRLKMQEHFALERESQRSFSLDFRIHNATGEERWIGHACQPVETKDGQWIGRRISNRDITDRKLAEQALLRSERLIAMGRLIASLAHEINNPLQAICANLDLVMDFPLPPKEKQEYLKVIRTEIDRLMKINSNILDFTRPHKLSVELTSIETLLHQALFLSSSQLKLHNIQTDLSISSELPDIKGSPEQLCQVFLNLIINATEHMPHYGLLKISANQEDKHILISFSDTGPGIANNAQELIFDPFYSTKKDGTGLGLSISQNIIQQHGGTIFVQNNPNGGAIFTIRLPILANISEHQ